MNNNIDSSTSSPAIVLEEMTFTSWDSCDSFLKSWSKNKGFNIIKNRVTKEGDSIRKRTYICEHGKKYTSKSNKDTSTKKVS